MNPLDVVAAIAATGLVAWRIFEETGSRRAPFAACVLLASAPLGGAVLVLALAAGIVLVRFHWALVPVPALALAVLVAHAPLVPAAASVLAATGSWVWGLVWVAAAAPFGWPGAVVALIAGGLGLAMEKHPANEALARTFRSASPWMLPVPALGLFGLASIGRATGEEWHIIWFGLLAASVGLLLSAAFSGLALRFQSSDGRPGALLALTAATVILPLVWAPTERLSVAGEVVSLLLVPLTLAAAPALPRLPRFYWIFVPMLPATAALS